MISPATSHPLALLPRFRVQPEQILHVQFRRMYSKTRDNNSTVTRTETLGDHGASRVLLRHAQADSAVLLAEIITSAVYFLAYHGYKQCVQL